MEHKPIEFETAIEACGLSLEFLQAQGITTLEEFLDLSKEDLINDLKLSPERYNNVFLQLAEHFKLQKKPAHAWSSEEVVAWLKSNGIAPDLIKAFSEAKITGRGLFALTYDDLGENIKVSVLKSKKQLWACIESLRKESKSFKPVTNDETGTDANQQEAEIIAVPELLIGDNPSTTLRLNANHDNWQKLKSAASRTEYLPRISFVGPTQCGKSHLLTELMSFHDRVVDLAGPSTAQPSQEHPTTGNINQYPGVVNGQKVVLLDGEGADGRTPLRFVQKLKQHIKNLVISHDKAEDYNQKRTEYVSKIFPRIFYITSNVIIFTNRQALANREYVTRIQQFALKSMENQQSRNLPYLIIIQNFANPPSEHADDPNENPYDVEVSTKKFLNSIENESRDCKQLLEEAFAGFCFLKIPDGRIFPTEYSNQIRELKMREGNKSYTLSLKNSFTDFMWYRVAAMVIQTINDDMDVNISDIFFRVNLPKDDSKLRAATKIFHEVYYSIPKPKGFTIREFVNKRVQRFRTARDIAIKSYCLGIVEDLRQNSLTDVDKDNVQKVLFEGYLFFLLRLLNQLQPCEFNDSFGCCTQDRNVHTCHTYENPTQSASLRYMIRKIARMASGIDDIQVTDDSLHVQKTFLDYLRTMLKKTDAQLLDERLSKFEEWPENPNEYKFWRKNCALCLSTLKQNLALYDCGHYFCSDCAHRRSNIVCPFHKKPAKYIDDKSKVPEGASPRVLSLDGGGVRGIILLRLLQQIELLTGARISELFDYIIGTSVGGIVTLAIGSNLSLEDVSEQYTDMVKKIFNNNFFTRLFRLGGSRYSMHELQKQLGKQFGDRTLSDLAASQSPRVAVVSSLESKNKVALMVSYTPVQDNKTIYFIDAPLYFAAAATSAAPLYFNPVISGNDVFVDGGIFANNPAKIGFEETTRVWSKPDILISLGTGLPPSAENETNKKSKSKSIIYWIKRFVDIATESVTVHQELEKTLSQKESFTHYFRFTPSLRKAIPLDSVESKLLKVMEEDTMAYVKENHALFISASAALIAKLFYATVSCHEKSYVIKILSRLYKERTVDILTYQRLLPSPHLHLDILSSKVAKNFHSIYINNMEVIESSPSGNLIHCQTISLNFKDAFGTFEFSAEKFNQRSVVAVVCLGSKASTKKYPISGCPISLLLHEDQTESLAASSAQ